MRAVRAGYISHWPSCCAPSAADATRSAAHKHWSLRPARTFVPVASSRVLISHLAVSPGRRPDRRAAAASSRDSHTTASASPSSSRSTRASSDFCSVCTVPLASRMVDPEHVLVDDECRESSAPLARHRADDEIAGWMRRRRLDDRLARDRRRRGVRRCSVSSGPRMPPRPSTTWHEPQPLD